MVAWNCSHILCVFVCCRFHSYEPSGFDEHSYQFDLLLLSLLYNFLTYMKLKRQQFFMDYAFMFLYRAFLRTGIPIMITLKLFDFVVNSFQMFIKRLQRNPLLQLWNFIFCVSSSLPKPVLLSSFLTGSNVPVTFLCYVHLHKYS